MKYTEAEKRAVATRFIAFRKTSLISQRELADLIGLKNRESVSNIERGLVMPHRSTMKRFLLLESKHKHDKQFRANAHSRRVAARRNSGRKKEIHAGTHDSQSA